MNKQCKTSAATKSSWEGKQWTRERKTKTKRRAKKTKNVQPKNSNKNIHLNAGDDDDALKWFGDWFCPLPDFPLLTCKQKRKSWQTSEKKQTRKQKQEKNRKRALPAAGDKCIKPPLHPGSGTATRVTVKLFGKLIFLTFNWAFDCLFYLRRSGRQEQKANRNGEKSRTQRAESREANRKWSEVEILNYLCSCIALCSSASLFLYCVLFSLLLFANFFDCFSSFGTSLYFLFSLLLFSLYVFLPLSLFTKALFTRRTGKDKGQVSRGIRKLTQIFGP